LPFVATAGAGYLTLSLLGRGSSLRNFSGRGLEATLRLLPAIVEWLTPVMIAAAAAGAVALLPLASSARQRRWAILAIGGVASTLAALLAASTVTNVYADYAVVMLPMVFVSAGGLIHLVAERAVERRGLLAAAVMA